MNEGARRLLTLNVDEDRRPAATLPESREFPGRTAGVRPLTPSRWESPEAFSATAVTVHWPDLYNRRPIGYHPRRFDDPDCGQDDAYTYDGFSVNRRLGHPQGNRIKELWAMNLASNAHLVLRLFHPLGDEEQLDKLVLR